MSRPDPAVPAHVPAHLVWNRSLAAFLAELDDPFLAGARLHDGPDVFWACDAAYGRPGWVITRQALLQQAFSDAEHFQSSGSIDLPGMLGVSWRLIPIETDPPAHTGYRFLLNPFFSPRAVSALDEAVREVCRSLTAAFEDRGSCEFISDFAQPFPSQIFLALMGMPAETAPQFLAWEHEMMRGPDAAARIAAGKAVCRYLEAFINAQRSNPSSPLLAGILQGRIEDRPLTDDEIMGILFTLYLGGLDTVYSTIGWVMRRLALEAPLQERLRARPEDLPAAVDELARAYSVVNNHRLVAKDLVFHGVEMRKGDYVILPTYLAGRDPQAHENPHAIDLERKGARLTFGVGRHICLGRELARREIRIVLETFLARFANIRIPPGEGYAYHTQGVLGIDRLPLAWDRR